MRSIKQILNVYLIIIFLITKLNSNTSLIITLKSKYHIKHNHIQNATETQTYPKTNTLATNIAQTLTLKLITTKDNLNQHNSTVINQHNSNCKSHPNTKLNTKHNHNTALILNCRL